MSQNSNLTIGAGVGAVAGAGIGAAAGSKRANNVIQNLDKTDLSESLKGKIDVYNKGLEEAKAKFSVANQTDEFLKSDSVKEVTKDMNEADAKTFSEQLKGLFTEEEGKTTGEKLAALSADVKDKLKTIFGLKAEEGKTIEDVQIVEKIAQKAKEMADNLEKVTNDFPQKFAKSTKAKWAAGVALVGAAVGGAIAFAVNKFGKKNPDKVN